MPALVAGIHVLLSSRIKDVDGRDKPGHDGVRVSINTKVGIRSRFPGAAHHEVVRCRPGIATDTASGTVPDQIQARRRAGAFDRKCGITALANISSDAIALS